MAVKDFVGSAVRIKQSLTFDMKELYKNLKTWFADRSYGIAEPSYSEKPTRDGLKKTEFVWCAEKKMDPYSKLVMDVVFKGETKDMVVDKEDKKQLVQEGDVEIIITCYIKRDLEDDYALKEKSGMQRFLRELVDKFSKKSKFEDYERKLQKDRDTIVYDIKTYLKMQRFD